MKYSEIFVYTWKKKNSCAIGHRKNQYLQSIYNLAQLKFKCQFKMSDFFHVFDKLFGIICDYGGQETTVPKITRCRMNSFVESFSKHFINPFVKCRIGCIADIV